MTLRGIYINKKAQVKHEERYSKSLYLGSLRNGTTRASGVSDHT